MHTGAARKGGIENLLTLRAGTNDVLREEKMLFWSRTKSRVLSIFISFDSATRAFWNFYFRESSVVPFWYVLHTYIVCPTSWESLTLKIGRVCQATPGRCPDDSNLPERSICCVKKREYDFTDKNIEDVCTQEQYVLPNLINRWLNSVMSDKFGKRSLHLNSIPT